LLSNREFASSLVIFMPLGLLFDLQVG
jgi:hypothetical protein